MRAERAQVEPPPPATAREPAAPVPAPVKTTSVKTAGIRAAGVKTAGMKTTNLKPTDVKPTTQTPTTQAEPNRNRATIPMTANKKLKYGKKLWIGTELRVQRAPQPTSVRTRQPPRGSPTTTHSSPARH